MNVRIQKNLATVGAIVAVLLMTTALVGGFVNLPSGNSDADPQLTACQATGQTPCCLAQNNPGQLNVGCCLAQNRTEESDEDCCPAKCCSDECDKCCCCPSECCPSEDNKDCCPKEGAGCCG